MEIDMNEQHWEQEACPKYDCRKENCKCGMKKVFLATALGDDSEDSPIAPKNGAYCNAIVVYEANEHVYIYSTEGIPTLVESGGKELEKLVEELEDGLAKEILDRQAADNSLQQEIDDIKNSPDVVDIVATYAALQAYDTSHLGNNDIIRVLEDETHDGQSTYYRWNKTTSTWTYIGAVGDYYTKGQVDNLLNAKQNTLTAGDNITITNDVISADGGIFLVRASETTSRSRTPDGSDLQDYAGQTGLYVDDVYLDPNISGLGNIYYVYNIGVDPETEDPYAEYALIANMQEEWTAIASVTDMMPIGGFGAPDSSTPGQAGQLYIDAQNYVLYVCIDDSNPYVWQQLGGGGDTVYSDKSTSNSSTGGAVYIGNLDANQAEQADPTSTDNHYKYLWALPYDNSETPQENSINIFGQRARANSIVIGYNASDSSNTSANTNILIGRGTYTSGNTARNVVIGNGAFSGSGALNCVCIGYNASTNNYISRSVAIGSNSYATRTGEVNIGESTGSGYNNTNYRVLGGVHDPVDAHDAATKGYVDANAGGDTVYSTKTTSSGSTGGAVYIGNLDATQTEQVDPTVTDAHKKYFWALPSNNSRIPPDFSINILGDVNGTNNGINNSYAVMLGADATTYAHEGIAIGHNAKADGQCVAIGQNAGGGNWSGKVGMVAVGNNTVADNSNYVIHIGGNSGNSYGVRGGSSDNSIAIGKNSMISNLTNSVALGAYAQATRQGEVNVGLVTGETTGGYNSTAYRVIGGVHDGQTDHDAVTLGQLNGRVKQNAGAPTTSTVGTVGQLLEDTTNGKLYQCTAIDTTDPNNPSYTWTELGGGDSVYLNGNKSAIYIGDSSTTSTSNITLLNGVTYNSSGSSIAIGVGTGKASIGLTARAESGIAIGNATITQGYKNITIGRNSYINPGVGWTDTCNVAIGDSAYISGTSNDPIKNAIALGANSKPTRTGEVNVGAQYGGAFNNTNYRVIGGVHDGEQDHDAVTIHQINQLIDIINLTLNVNIQHIGS